MTNIDQADTEHFLRLVSGPDGTFAIRTLLPQDERQFNRTRMSDALEYVARHNGRRPIYAVLQVIKPDCKARYISQDNIAALRWLPIDADPVRPADSSSTDAELAAAKARIHHITTWLEIVCPGIAASIVTANSGNGGHALIRLPDYQMDEHPRFEALGKALARRFSDGAVKSDAVIYNAARIWRLPGTQNIKGKPTPERPHRTARLDARIKPDPYDIFDHWADLDSELDITQRQAKSFPVPVLTDPRQTENATGTKPAVPPWWAEPIAAGGRNEAAYRRTRWLVNPTEGNRTKADAWSELQAWNKSSCSPQLEIAELQLAFDSAVKRGANTTYVAPKPSDNQLHVRPQPKYPEPPAEEAYYGLSGQIAHTIGPHTESDPIALLTGTLLAFGSVIGRAAYTTAEADKHHCNLFAVHVGVSSKGRKGTAWGHVRGLFTAVDPDWATNRIKHGLSTGEGLGNAVRDPTTKVSQDKGETEPTEKVIDGGVLDKRLFAIEPEFASVLKLMSREGNNLSPTIRCAWDNGNLATLTKSNPTTATGAHITILGHITRDELRRCLTDTEAGNGFANRFEWFCVRRSKELPEGGKLNLVEMDALAVKLTNAATFAREVGEVERDEGARRAWAAAYSTLSAGHPGLMGAVTSRAEAQVTRLSTIYALLDFSKVIRVEHLMAALALWEYAENSARYIFGDSMGNPTADRILDALRSTPAGLDRTSISEELFKNHATKEALDAALALLADSGLARCERTPTDGRSRELWTAA